MQSSLSSVKMSRVVPIVPEEIGNQVFNYDIFSRILKDRIIFLNGEVEDVMANNIVSQLIFLNQQSDKPITMYINSPGGSVTAGLSIYDTMNNISAQVNTVCIGQACSMGAFLLSAGDTRFAAPSSRIMIHQPLGGYQGQTTDIAIHTREIESLKYFLTKVIAVNCGQDYEKVAKDCERDYFLRSDEALAYGLIDHILPSSNLPNKRASKIDLKEILKETGEIDLNKAYQR